MIEFSRIPKINPTKKPDTTAFASLSTSPAKNPTLIKMAIMNEAHDNPIQTPIIERIIAAINSTIVGFMILLKFILSTKPRSVLADWFFGFSPVKMFVPHSRQKVTSSSI